MLTGLGLSGVNWRVPEHYEGSGGVVLEASMTHGLDGVVAKKLNGTYLAGRRSRDWTVVAGTRVQEVVIGGWRPGGGTRATSFGSLLVGIPEGAALRYAGNVGVGFTRADLAQLAARLRRLERKRSPFHAVPSDKRRNARWVQPELVGEVVFREWTDAGCLRTPRWRGLLPGAQEGRNHG